MSEVLFWSLRQKFLDDTVDAPESSQQVMYYSLAIGHHVGVIDCLKVALRCPLDEYEQWLKMIDNEAARRKLRGVLTFGEIVIDSTHINLLAPALEPLAKNAPAPWGDWSRQMINHLHDISQEPALYLMAKTVISDLSPAPDGQRLS